MRIITISREFGSGGREIGKDIAQKLGYDYYDKEIICAIAKNMGVNADDVEKALDHYEIQAVPLHYYCTFSGGTLMPLPQTEMLLEQKKVIEAIAKKGKDCVIVGRNADAILKKYNPFNIFLCADMDEKVNRCMQHLSKNDPKTRKELEKEILSVDKRRARTRELITGSKWGDKYSYHIVLNTAKWNKDRIVDSLISLIDAYYKESE